MRHFGDIALGTLELFCLCAEEGRFTAAAVRAGVTSPAVSRSIGRLEQRLGVILFARTTRRVTLTEAGQRYYQYCQQALASLREGEAELAGEQLVPRGTVRLSLPTPFGQLRVLPLLPDFQRRYPDVQLSLQMSNRNVDFIADGFDIAVRMRTPPDSELIARHLGDASLLVVAAPDYLARAGAPATLSDLAAHRCIRFLLPSSGQAVPWEFLEAGSGRQVEVSPGLSVEEDPRGCVALAASGGGLLQTYRFMVQDALDDGSLVEVLPGYAGRSRPVHLLYPKRNYLPLRIRVLIDFLYDNLRGSVE